MKALFRKILRRGPEILIGMGGVGFLIVAFAGAYLYSCSGNGDPVFAQSSVIAPHPTWPVDVPPPPGVYNSPTYNLEDMDLWAFGAATGTIQIAAYAMTDGPLANELVQRAKAGVHIQIYRDHTEVASECRGDVTCARAAWHELLGLPNVEIRVKKSTVLMHLKAYELTLGDGRTLVRDGSANFSPAGLLHQDNSAIYSFDPAAAANFRGTFQAMWGRKDNLTVAEAVQTAPAWGKKELPGSAVITHGILPAEQPKPENAISGP